MGFLLRLLFGKSPMTRHDVRLAVKTAWDTRTMSKLVDRLNGVDSIELFHGIFPLAVAAQGPGHSPIIASLLLLLLEPPSPLSAVDAVRELLPEWDVSAEEVPVYLVSQYGKRQLHTAMVELEQTQTLSNDEKVRLQTIRYWIAFPLVNLINNKAREWDRLVLNNSRL
jgi:hypothetical protein